jgi:1,4-alpha-glucan branching enzyme
MLFMGQEFLEDKQWSDNVEFHQNLLPANSLLVFAR